MKMRRLLWVITAALVLISGGMASRAFALEPGSYVVSNTTYYVNPDTGVADDGGDTSTGEGMCRNSTYSDSLYEFKDGKHYVTVRIKLISFIKNVRFKVQGVKGDGNSYRDAGYVVTGENKDENTRDYRLELPAADVLINPSFFVGPMNRDVTYFMGLNLNTSKKDDGSFAAFNKTAAEAPPPAEAPVSGAQTSPSSQGEAGKADEASETSQGNDAKKDAGAGGNNAAKGETTADMNDDAAPPAEGDEPAADAEESPDGEEEEILGIMEYPAGDEVPEEPEAGGGRIFLGVIVAGLCVAAGGAYVLVKRKP